MRVALVHSRYSNAVPSGENAAVDAEYQALVRAGVDVRLFQTDPDVIRRDKLYAAKAAVRVAFSSGFAFEDAVRAFAPDVLHVHNAFPDLGESGLSRLPFPIVLTAHNYRSFCANGYAYRDGHTCTDCVSRPTGSWNAVRHGCFHGRVASVPLALRNRGGPAANPLIDRARRVLVPSEQARRVLVTAGLPAEKAVVSPHFLPDDLIPSATEKPTRTGQFLFIGRLTPEKGLDVLLPHWPSDQHLLIVGEGDLRTRLMASWPQNNIEFAGRRPREQVVRLLAGARALVFTSRWWETFGLVAMEALAVGTPILSVGAHAVGDLVREHGVGHAVESVEDIPAAIAAIERVSPATWQERTTSVFREVFAESVWSARRLGEYAEAIR